MNTPENRINFIISELGFTNESFADKLEITLDSFNNKPLIETLSLIMTVFPFVNVTWILTGEGNWRFIDITKAITENNRIENLKEHIDWLTNELKFMREQNTLLLNYIIKITKK